MRSKLGAQAQDEVDDAGESILNRLRSLPAFVQTSTLCTHVGFNNEVPTIPIIRDALKTGRKVFVPIVVAVDDRLRWSRLRAIEHLAPGRFGVPELAPEHRDIAEPPDDSVTIVPGMAFTKQGARLGRGGGYFDRFLATYAGVSIGLAYNWQIIDTIPEEPHDMRVDYVVTPEEVYVAN